MKRKNVSRRSIRFRRLMKLNRIKQAFDLYFYPSEMPTTTNKIIQEINRIVHKYPRPDSAELFRSELIYLVEQTIKDIGNNEGREESTVFHLNRILTHNN